MTVDSLLAAAAADIVSHAGKPATYTPAGGAAVSVSVFFAIEIEEQPGGYEGPAWAQIKTIEGILADFGQEPNEGDTIEINGTSYTVKRVLENDGLFCKVAVR